MSFSSVQAAGFLSRILAGSSLVSSMSLDYFLDSRQNEIDWGGLVVGVRHKLHAVGKSIATLK
jgi:hypothetical protein